MILIFFFPISKAVRAPRIAEPTSFSSNFHRSPAQKQGLSTRITLLFVQLLGGYDVRYLTISRDLVVFLQLGLNEQFRADGLFRAQCRDRDHVAARGCFLTTPIPIIPFLFATIIYLQLPAPEPPGHLPRLCIYFSESMSPLPIIRRSTETRDADASSSSSS